MVVFQCCAANNKENSVPGDFALGFIFDFDQFYLGDFHCLVAWAWDMSCQMTEPQRLLPND